VSTREDAIKRFEAFHQFPARKVGELGCTMPKRCTYIGPGIWVAYRSDKWTKKKENYIHHHAIGVNTYICDPDFPEDTNVPASVLACDHLVFLGQCLGVAFKRDGEEQEIAPAGKDELFCTPSGNCLVIVRNRKQVIALSWGGTLRVDPEGIKG
jgi:hypothetical protein